MSKAIFLDRDGVLNIEKGHYISQVEDFEINKQAITFLQTAINKGYKLIVITNQGGIAKGIYSTETLFLIHKKMKEEFSLHNIVFDYIYYCPHHDDHGKCLCRKPDSLMIEKAIHRFQLTKSQSFMIGDRSRDIDAAQKAGIVAYQIESNQSLESFISLLQ